MSRRLLSLALGLAGLLAAPAASRATSFRLPLDGCDPASKCLDSNKCYVTAYYDQGGKDWHCGSWHYEGHQGTDFGVQGTVGVRPVVAGANGTVLETHDGCGTGSWGNTCGGGFGNYVKIEHADGKVTTYGHMLAGTLKVKQGNSVSCGQELGRAGNSGNSSGPHLHFEVDDPTYGVDDPYAGGCGGPLSYWVSQGAYCTLPSSTCEGACTGDCSGRQCGADGCGAICGACTGADYCTVDGQCVSDPTDDSYYVTETIPDGTHFKPGQSFTKTWTLKNTGDSAWTKAGGFSLAYQREETFGAPAYTWPGETESIAPNASKVWSLPMTAPLTPGTYRGYWQMQRGGQVFGASLWVEIVVDEADTDIASLMSESLQDGTVFVAGAKVTKTWTMMNGGTATWTKAGGYQWKFLHGDLMTAPTAVDLGASESVLPSKTKVWSVTMTAPANPGAYRGYWGMVHGSTRFGPEVWVEIAVTAPQPKDQDGDGFPSTATGGNDCNDSDPNMFPGNPEKCDNKDNDCNGTTDEGLSRACVKLGCPGAETCAKGVWASCTAAAPVAEQCNGTDDDCNGFTDDRASCPAGYGCLNGQCEALPDAGLPRVDAGAPRPDAGKPDAGCITAGPCTSPEGCRSGLLSCADFQTCVNLKVRADGSPCPGGACRSGECVACPTGESCTYGDGCLIGEIDCATGSPVCSKLAAAVEFTPCSGGWCRNGACRSIPDAGRPDADAPGLDAASLPRPDAHGFFRRDAGAPGHAPPGGCGCQAGAGGAWGALLLAGVAMLRRRR